MRYCERINSSFAPKSSNSGAFATDEDGILSYYYYILPTHYYFFTFTKETTHTLSAENGDTHKASRTGINLHVGDTTKTATVIYIHYFLCTKVGYCASHKIIPKIINGSIFL